MQNREKIDGAGMLKNKEGFTLLEMLLCLLCLSLFFLLLPRLQFLFIEVPHSKQISDWEWNVFLQQIQLEFQDVRGGSQSGKVVMFQTEVGNIITYTVSGSRIVRKVNGAGHEVLLQKVKHVSYELTPHTLWIRVQDESGKMLHGVVTRYSSLEVYV